MGPGKSLDRRECSIPRLEIVVSVNTGEDMKDVEFPM